MGIAALVGKIGLGGQIHSYKSCITIQTRRAGTPLDNTPHRLTERHCF
jgi:hypothetical protein